MTWALEPHLASRFHPSKSASLYSKKRSQPWTRICSRKAKVKHKTAFSMLKFTVFFFDISRKALKKAGKALKTAPFVSFRAKPWFWINGRDAIRAEKSDLSSKQRFVALISAFMPSELGATLFSKQDLKMRSWNGIKASFWGLDSQCPPLSEIQSARVSRSSRKTW